MDWMLGFLVAMSVTMALIPPLMQMAGRWQVLDAPGDRKVHATPIPRVGGIAMAFGLLLGLAFFGDFAQPMPAYLAGVIVLLIFGVLDDRFTLTASQKFVGQILATLLVMLWGDISIDSLTLVERHQLPAWIAAPLTFLFILGVTNAINLADGLDGLAGGTTLLSLSALALLSLKAGHPFVGAVAVTGVGAILGFLRFNTHPARVFMGDGGSQLLGFSAGVLAIVLTQEKSSPLSTALPLLLLGVPIIDTLMVMTRRILARRSPFAADRNHIHHRLLTYGFDHHEAVVVIYCLQALLFVAAWFLRFESDLLIITVFSACAVCVVATLHCATRHSWTFRRAGSQAVHATSLGRAVHWSTRPQRLPRWALITIAVALSLYFLAVGIALPSPSLDVRIMAIVLTTILAHALVWHWSREQAGWLEKGALYTAVVMAVYFDAKDDLGLGELLAAGEWIIFIALAVAVVVRFRLSSDRRFQITSLDVLVVFAAIAVPNLPGALSGPLVGTSMAKLIALLYGLESLLGAPGRMWRIPCVACLGLSVMCALRGV